MSGDLANQPIMLLDKPDTPHGNAIQIDLARYLF